MFKLETDKHVKYILKILREKLLKINKDVLNQLI